MKNVSERIRSAPGFCQVTVKIHLRVAGKKATEDEAVEALGLAIGGEARVEIDGISFDEEGEGGRIEFCGMRAAEKKEFATQDTECTEKTEQKNEE